MIRIEIELSRPAPLNSVLELGGAVVEALAKELKGDVVVHRISVEEADA